MSASLRSVELVEENAPVAPTFAVAARFRWAAFALAVVLVGVAVVLQHRDDARADARAARLAAVDGILAPLDGSPLEARWKLDHPDSSVAYGRPADGVLVGGSSVDGVVELHGADVRTGAVLWRTPVTVPADETLWAWCDPVSTSTGTELGVCTAGPDGPAAAIALSSRTMWTVVPRTGEVLASWRARGDASVLVTDDQLVMMSSLSSRSWQVQALDPATARPLWTFVPPIPLTRADFVQPQLVDDGAGHVLVSTGGHVWLLDHDGRVVLDRSTAHGTWWGGLRRGTLLGRGLWSAGQPGAAILRSADLIPLDGRAVQVFPDDGTAADVLLTLEPGASEPVLVARSATDGGVLWRRTGNVLSALVLDGTLYLGGARDVTAVEAATGRTRWTQATRQGVNALSTDGDELVVLAPPTTVTAYALGDGHRTWSHDVATIAGIGPIASVDLAPGSGALVAWGRDGSVTMLG